MANERSIAGAVAVCVLAVTALVAPALAATEPAHDVGAGAAATDGPSTEPAFAVAPQSDGTAELRVTYAFDLSDGSRAAAFQELRNNETAAQAFEDRFRDRIQRVAADAAAATGREMRIDRVDLRLHATEGTGVAEFAVTWDGLAAVDGDRLAVTEPFASGFAPDRPVHLVAPDGYTVADGPGFAVLGALVAVALAVGLALRRR